MLGGLSGVSKGSVTGRSGQAVGGKGMLRAFKTGISEGGVVEDGDYRKEGFLD